MATDTKSQEMLDNLAVPGYEDLAGVFREAYRQAAVGKGAERHAGKGEAFADQVMQDGAKRFGVGALLFQAYKKSEESQRLPLDRGTNELLGAMVYLAGAVIARRKAEGDAGIPASENAVSATLDLKTGWYWHDGKTKPAFPDNTQVEYETVFGGPWTGTVGDLSWDGTRIPPGSQIRRWRKL